MLIMELPASPQCMTKVIPAGILLASSIARIKNQIHSLTLVPKN